MAQESGNEAVTRRSFLQRCAAGAAGIAVGGAGLAAGLQGRSKRTVWQLDPEVCVHCGKCATECVLQPSAVKCMHTYEMCGYCNLCFGYFEPEAPELTSGAENQLCPVGAITRRFVEEPYYQYTIDEELCIGCGICVKHCNAFGNGSLYLQVRHDRCLNCNECAIAQACPVDAFVQLPVHEPYISRTRGEA